MNMGKTWKEFKAEVDGLLAKKGFDEDVKLDYIDVDGNYEVDIFVFEENRVAIEG